MFLANLQIIKDKALTQQIAGVKMLMARGMNKAKQHHYVPSSYLERFTDDCGFLHVYDRRRRVGWRQKPDEAMTINKYYRQEWVPEGVDQTLWSRRGVNGWKRTPRMPWIG